MTERMRNDIAKSAAVIEKARRLETRLTRDALLAHAQSDHSCGPGTPHAIALQDRASVASFANGGDNHLVGLAFEDFPIGIEATQIGAGSGRTGRSRLAAGPSGSGRPGFAAHPLRPSGALQSRVTLRPGGSGRTWRTLCPGWTLRPRDTLRPGRAGRT
jgi:hypothetical protein